MQVNVNRYEDNWNKFGPCVDLAVHQAGQDQRIDVFIISRDFEGGGPDLLKEAVAFANEVDDVVDPRRSDVEMGNIRINRDGHRCAVGALSATPAEISALGELDDVEFIVTESGIDETYVTGHVGSPLLFETLDASPRTMTMDT